ncbi:MAG: hypothetical protein KDC30_10615 [Saprospiraceae bacterium]|nr:hypothetical protein [Saprospiraceae bacterium]
MKHPVLHIALVLATLTARPVVAQQGPPPGVGSGDITFQPDSNATDPSIDTSDIYVLYAELPEQEYDFPDTLLGRDITQYDPIRLGPFDRGHLGNLGSPSYRLIFTPGNPTMGFHLGYDGFDLYRVYADQLAFYRLQQAMTKAYFSQGPTQENTYFQLQFGRSFANQTQLALDYRRINNEGALFHQRALDNALAVGLRHESAGKRYQFFATFATNSTELQENGGITAEPTNSQGQVILVSPLTISVELESPETRYATRELLWTHYLNLRTAQDTTGENRRALTVGHRLNYRTDVYKFYDDQPAADSSFYGNFQVDSRGIRHYVEHRRLENRFELKTFTMAPTDSTGVRRPRDLLSVGLLHQWHWLQQEPVDSTFQAVFLTGRMILQPVPRVRLEAYAHYGVLGNLGDYRLEGKLWLDLKKVGQWRFQAISQLQSPSLLEQRLYLTQELFWENDFKKTLETTLAAALLLPDWGIEVEGRYNLIANYLYFDSLGVARQSGTAISIPQLVARAQLHLGVLHFENELTLQRPSGDLLRLPSLYSRHSLYLEGRIFRQVMLARLGFDLRLHSDFLLPGYQPIFSQYTLQEEQSTGWQPLVDAFFAFKVKKFRFFLRVENLAPLLTTRYYYLAAGYPIAQTGVRFGLSWQFVD